MIGDFLLFVSALACTVNSVHGVQVASEPPADSQLHGQGSTTRAAIHSLLLMCRLITNMQSGKHF